MNLTDLKSFLAVIEYRSLTLAAKKLHVTQSAMTKRIQRLENELDARLVIVDGIKTKVTDAGKIFLPYARQMLAMDGEMRSNIKDAVHQTNPAFIIGTSIYLAHYIMPYFVQDFCSKNQNSKINIKVINERDFFESLDNGYVDLVICSTRPEVSKTIYSEELWREKLSLAFSDSHPLANEISYSLSVLSKYEAIFPERKGYIREKVDKLFSSRNLELKSSIDAGTIYSVRNFISTGKYWSFVHKRLLDMTELRTADLVDASLEINFSAYCVKRRQHEKVISDTLQHFKIWMADSDIIRSYSLL